MKKPLSTSEMFFLVVIALGIIVLATATINFSSSDEPNGANPSTIGSWHYQKMKCEREVALRMLEEQGYTLTYVDYFAVMNKKCWPEVFEDDQTGTEN